MRNEKHINTDYLDVVPMIPASVTVKISLLDTKEKIYETYELIKQQSPALTFRCFTVIQDAMLNEGYRCLGAHDGQGNLVGMCGYWIRHRFCSRKTVHIDHMIVTEKLRHMGIGSALMNEIDAIAEREHCFNIVMETFADNKKAQAFFLNKGLTLAGVNFVKHLVD